MLIAPKNSVPVIKDSLNTPAYEIKLDTVLGLTVTSNAALACDPQSEVVAYPAGCTVVLYNTRKNRQHHILNASRKTITCVAFSTCGRYLATGECGHAPCVRIWDLQDQTSVVQLAEFPSHKYGVNCVSFSVNSKYLVSVGSQHDMIVNVWEWRAGLKLASNKVSSKVKAVGFAEGGGHFVTVGNRHVKFWYLEYSRGAKYKEPVPLMGRSAILGELRNNDFCDVACGRGVTADSTFAITKSGLLCEFNNRRLLDKWVELRTPSANCMSLGTNLIFVGCADGIVRCFSPETLQFVTTLPRTHYLGVDVSQGLNISHMFSHPPDAKYPDAIALSYDEKNYRLTCVYNDHSLYVWDVRDIKRVGKSHSSLYHSACIWGVEVPPPPQQSQETGALIAGPLPPGSFLTCSSDDTVRVWNLSSGGANAYGNIYSDELQRVLYMDPELTYLKDVDLSSVGEKDKPVSYDGKNGVRCIRVSGDGRHLACGDRAGNVRVHDLVENREVCRLEAHNAEVLCLEYCGGAAGTPGRRLLASASRDRLIHVFDVDQGYNFMQTLDDHSSSITAVRFLPSENNLQMVSCGADKTILFRSLVESPNGGSGQFQRGHNCSARGTLYDMEVDVPGRHVLAACQDRAVRVYNTRSGRHTKTFRASTGDEGSIIKVVLDRSGIYVATSCTNKSLSVYDYYSGECMATMYGHSELVTGLRFTADCQHLISASGDGCIFVWRVPHDMVVTMRARLAQQAIRQGRPVSSNGLPLDSESDRAGSPILGMHMGIPPAEDPLVLATRQDPSRVGIPQLDLHRLPPWAQKTIAGEATQLGPTSPLKAVVRGKWAKRAENNDYKADYYMEPERPMESDGSKDSSLDSGTDTRVYVEPKQDMTDLNYKQNVSITTKTSRINDRVRHLTDDSSLGSFKYEDHESTEHDGDIEDISDGERTSSDHNQAADRIIYYPSNNDDMAPSEYTVNAMDVDELRQSQRRQRKPLLPLPLVTVSATSVSGSGQDSDEDEDEVSTPSGDNADRNPLSGSCESLEKMSHQMSKSLLTAFESLSGAEIDSNMEGNTSISSQHHKTSPRTAPAIPPRNAALISATKKAMANPENTIKRIELSKRIADTKKALEKVGYNSKLRASKSSVDLSYSTEREADTRSQAPRARPLSQNLSAASNRGYGAGSRNRASNNDFNSLIHEDQNSGLRRAISLSDLAFKPSPSPRTSLQVSGKSAQGGSNSKLSGSRPSVRHSKQFSSNMTRSSSVGVLNQSDSESEAGAPSSRNNTSRVGGLMRPTISSQNKAAPLAARRRGVQTSYSTVNLSSVGQEDSSSEENGGNGTGNGTGGSLGGLNKPAVPPRPSRAVVDSTQHRKNMGRSGSDRDLSSKAREVTHRLTAGNAPSRKHSAPSMAPLSLGAGMALDPNTGQVTPMACQQLAQQLTKLTAKIVQMYSSLSGSPSSSGDFHDTFPDNAGMLQGLESAMMEAQKMLSIATIGRPRLNGVDQQNHHSLSSEHDDTHYDVRRHDIISPSKAKDVNDLASKLDELVSKSLPSRNGDLNQGQAMQVMGKITDVLYEVVNNFGTNNHTNSSPNGKGQSAYSAQGS